MFNSIPLRNIFAAFHQTSALDRLQLMAQAKKKAERATKQGVKKRSGAAASGAPSKVAAMNSDVEQVIFERDQALQKLAIAEQQIKQLKDNNSQVVNRIAWVLDSLHSLRDKDR